MRRFARFASALVLLAIGGRIGSAAGQLAEQNYSVDDGIPIFFTDAVTLAAEDSSLSVLRIGLKVSDDELQFIQEGDHFKASYEAAFGIYDLKGNMVDTKTVRKELNVAKYSETNSVTSFSAVEAEFVIKPGEYAIQVVLTDLDSKKSGQHKTRWVVPEYSAVPFSISGIRWMESIGVDSIGRPVIVPSVMGNFGEKDSSLFVSFEVYRSVPMDSVAVFYTIANPKKDILKSTPGLLRLTGFRTPAVLEIARKDLKGGRYLLKVFVKSGKQILERSIPFTVRWIGMPVSTSDVARAAEQMKYIARGGDIKKIKKAKGSEQERLFKEFWASKDPTPGTEKNELMEEYYRRVSYANDSFGTYNEGWKTDMGMVYIILGPPNDVERFPFEQDSKPYEVWYYYTINRRFTFVDYTGFGEYRLINTNWEDLRRYQ